jgi:hypothetical protein
LFFKFLFGFELFRIWFVDSDIRIPQGNG